MNQYILDYIKHLSKKDNKDLVQKTLKTTEEVGELARKVLAFNKGDGIYKFTDKKSILEEVSDIIISSISIAYDLGLKDDDINSTIQKKILYWNEVQNKQKQIDPNEIPFEIHIIVDVTNTNDSINNFKDLCYKLGVTPIIEYSNDPIIRLKTLSNILTNREDVFNECQKISKSFRDEGFNVIREKIETVIWYPFADNKKIKGQYFESHFTIICDEKRRNFLEIVLNKWNCHLSQYIFEKLDNDEFKIMATYRDDNCIVEKFKDKTKIIKRELKGHGFDVDKVVKEFCIYDTNELDN